MWGIVGTGVILLVARVAQRAVQRIVVVGVAISAKARRDRMRTGELESRAGVVERAISPLNGVVAGLARGWETRCDVIHRRQGTRVVLGVAREACRAIERVVVVHVAVGALARWNRVRPGQRKSSAVVVEGCVQPRTGVVALVAARREIRRDVVRIRGSLIVGLVARVASRAGQVVVVALMAVGAEPWRHGVHARQRKSCGRVIELAVGPLHRVMTLFAGGGEAGMRHWAQRFVVVVLVATHAGGAGDFVVIVDVAIAALTRRHGVRPGQRKSGLRVIEGRWLPG